MREPPNACRPSAMADRQKCCANRLFPNIRERQQSRAPVVKKAHCTAGFCADRRLMWRRTCLSARCACSAVLPHVLATGRHRGTARGVQDPHSVVSLASIEEGGRRRTTGGQGSCGLGKGGEDSEVEESSKNQPLSRVPPPALSTYLGRSQTTMARERRRCGERSAL